MEIMKKENFKMNKKNNEIEKTTIDETAEEIKNEENKETKVYGIVCG